MKDLVVGGQKLPALGLGTWQIQGDACEEAVLDALALGYRHIDTAQGYENESRVGDAVARSGIPREDVFITTKIWVDERSEDEVRNGVDESLRRLRTDYVDLFLVHWPPRKSPIELALDTLFALQRQGKIRMVGVSNFTSAQLDVAQRVGPIACNQVELHPLLGQRWLLERAEREGFVVTAYSPLAQGRVLREPVLNAIAERHGRSAAEVTLAWLLSKPNVCVIPKAASAAHRRSNLAACDLRLEPEEFSAIDRLDRGERLLDPPWAPAWD